MACTPLWVQLTQGNEYILILILICKFIIIFAISSVALYAKYIANLLLFFEIY